MSDFGLEKRYINYLLEVLSKYISNPAAEFYIFGSRSKGTYKKYSDVDIAINDANLKISTLIINKIKAEFENSTFPYEVDIVDLNSINESFLKIIRNDLKKIN